MDQEEELIKACDFICDKLQDRDAVLFLGAGINYGLKSSDGNTFPLANDLSKIISVELLGSSDLDVTLEESAEMAKYRIGDRDFNDFLFKYFSKFKPNETHTRLASIPWDVIYTTNYDLLIEKADEKESKIRQIFSMETDLSSFSDSDILYYKLHGSIDFANTPEGRLIITKEDYRNYDLNRKPLFSRLQKELMSKTFVFIGYGLKDDNFRNIIDDCRSEINVQALPLSYCIRVGVSDIEKAFWKAKYNIIVINCDGDKFVKFLFDSWHGSNLSDVSRKSKKSYYEFEDRTKFPKFGECFYELRPSEITGVSQPLAFFKGREATWPDIRDKVAPYRDAYYPLLEELFEELVHPNNPPSLYLITGHAGTGKTTLVRTLGFELARDFDIPVFFHIPGTALSASALGSLVDRAALKRIIICIRHAAEYISQIETFLEDCRTFKLPVTIILEERKNQWSFGYVTANKKFSYEFFDLGGLSEKEILEILGALEKHNALGKLTGAPKQVLYEHFKSVANHELLVALRELTSEDTFDKIITDEFEKIPNQKAKEAYVYVSALSQYDLPIRYDTLFRVAHIDLSELVHVIFKATEGILITGEDSGQSRHNSGFRLLTRHPIIASIIFDKAAGDDERKFDVFNNLLNALDLGFPEDRFLLNQLIKKRELVNVFVSAEKRRAIFEKLEKLQPNNPFVLQHRAILEKDLGEADKAVDYAWKAVDKDKSKNPGIRNTYGLCLEFQARFISDSLRYQAIISEATKIFDENLKIDPSNPYNYLGHVFLHEQKIFREKDPKNKAILRAGAISLLEEAYEKTNESEKIATELAKQKAALGDLDGAHALLENALVNAQGDRRLRDILIRFKMEKEDYKGALVIAQDGVKFDPTSWQLQRHIARIKRMLSDTPKSIIGYYEASIRHNKSDINLLIEYASYLFQTGMYRESNLAFEKTKEFTLSLSEKRRFRNYWKNDDGTDRLFNGKVKNIYGAMGAAISIPENIEVHFFRGGTQISKLKQGDSISFYVGFTAKGPQAWILLDNFKSV